MPQRRRFACQYFANLCCHQTSCLLAQRIPFYSAPVTTHTAYSGPRQLPRLPTPIIPQDSLLAFVKCFLKSRPEHFVCLHHWQLLVASSWFCGRFGNRGGPGCGNRTTLNLLDTPFSYGLCLSRSIKHLWRMVYAAP